MTASANYSGWLSRCWPTWLAASMNAHATALQRVSRRRVRVSRWILDLTWEVGMQPIETLEVPVAGMDCTECTVHVQKAIAALPGVKSVDVFLASEKAVVQLDPTI